MPLQAQNVTLTTFTEPSAAPAKLSDPALNAVPDGDRLAPPASQAPAKSDEYFDNSHCNRDLAGRSIRGGLVTMCSQAIKLVLKLTTTAILARLLTPEDFGIVAMVTVITGFAELFKDAGLSTATVQRQNITQGQVSALFWINVVISCLIAALTALMAPAIAWVYREPRLLAVTLVLSVTIIFGGLAVQHQALLRRNLRFKELAIIEVSSMFLGLVVAVVMAYLNFHYWALIGMTAMTAFATAVLSTMISGWRPGLPRRNTGVRPMLRFGGGLAAFNVLSYVNRNADNMVAGMVLGSTALGLYSRAYTLMLMPFYHINTPLTGIVVPTLSRLQSEPRKYAAVYLEMLALLACVSTPIVALLFVAAEDVIALFLGSEWKQAVPLFRYLAPAALCGTFSVAPYWLCVTLGRSNISLRWGLVSAPAMLATFIVGAQFGIEGLAIGFSTSWLFLLVLFIWMACTDSPIAPRQVLLTAAPPLLASVATAALCMLLNGSGYTAVSTPIVGLAINTAMFIPVYCGLIFMMPSTRATARKAMQFVANAFHLSTPSTTVPSTI
ncbi:MAG: rane protein involved in the export of O-antigen and teichoic acid [Schlesneria sp.]|nr:rane protein involved in the export of O-antigen and teichoic acid [Schlesneria sp.]